MVSLNDLFMLSADELFQNYSISDIKLMQNELEKEINKKKDEIRILVGEKYRDFVEVSDKISIMDELARNITNRINIVSSALATLNIGPQDEKPFQSVTLPCTNQTKNTIAILVKLLIDVQDQIWFEIGNCRFMTATTLLQLSVHIKTVLNLETTWHIDRHFPIVLQLWNSILRFPVVLTQLVEEKLKTDDLSLTTACECLCTLTILENLDYVELVGRFLKLRTETLRSTLNNENVTSNVRARILSSFQIMINTFEVLYYCFRKSDDDNNGNYWKQMQNMTAPCCEPALNLVNLDNTARYGNIYVPMVVRNFKVKMMKSITPSEPSDYCRYIKDWLVSVQEQTTLQIANLLNLIGSLQTLHLLKDSVPPLSKDWSSIMEYFNQKRDTNLWNEIYEPLITERAKTLLLQQWNALFARIRHKVETLIQEISENKKQEPEDNLHWFLWESFEDDLMEKASSDTKTPHAKGLSIKSSCLSPNAGKLCIFIESLISGIMNELCNICSVKDSETEESTVLKQHQQHCSLVLIERLINLTQELANSGNVTEAVMLFLARFLSGIPMFCPSLKQCVSLLDSKGEKWLNVNAKLQEVCLNIWRKWSDVAASSILSEFNSQIPHVCSPVFAIKHFPKWDLVKLTEETEDGNQVDSELKVPLQASFPVQDLLNSFASLIGRALPPKIITMEMTSNILNGVFHLFENVHEESTFQMVFVQFLFDVKYLTVLLIPVENNNLIARSNHTVAVLETKVDPVDLDAVAAHLSQNVRQFAYRTQGIFGLLINDKPRFTIDQYSDNSDDPHVAYCGTISIPWFPLLPVSTVHVAKKT